jgi:serine/threonine protein kinase
MNDKIISHYRIINKLGEGGMGVLYLAEDLELSRKAVLKFLPKEMESDPDINLRFKREAQAAGSLSHPNIVTIYDVGVHENKTFIAMEYVEGKTLRDLIKGDELTIEQIKDIAIQICEGLNEAHSKGIIHRDIKPENVLIDEKGKVKIVDFGLAKVKNTSKELTKEASTLGTIKYMSPEQIRNQKVDQRTDIWSFGVILYEMITGRYPFKGEHDASLFYSIINQTPEPLARYKADVNESFQRIIDKALDKEPGTRYQHIDEVLSDLRRNYKIIDQYLIFKIRKSKKFKFLSIGLLTAGIIAIFFSFFKSSSLQINPNMSIKEVTMPLPEISWPSMSADGNWITFAASDKNGKWDIYLMHTKIKEPHRITNDSSGFILDAAISPDGSQILFSKDYELYIVPSIGGVKKKLVSNAEFGRWRPDGQRILFYRESSSVYEAVTYWSINPDGSDANLEFSEKPTAFPSSDFSYNPFDFNSIVFLRTYPEGYQELIFKKLDTGFEKQLTYDKKNIGGVWWTSKNAILFSSNKTGSMNIWMIPDQGGETIQITKGNGQDIVLYSSLDLTKILCFQLRDYSHLWIRNLENSETHQITSDERLITNPIFSPDHNKILFTTYTALATSNQIYIMDRNGDNLRQVTSGNFRNVFPLFSPNGRFIAYTQYSISDIDSGKVIMIETKNPHELNYICSGRAEMWIDNKSLLVIKNHHTEIIDIESRISKIIYKDSTLAYPVLSGKFLFYIDLHPINYGKAFMISADYKENPSAKVPQYLFSYKDLGIRQMIKEMRVSHTMVTDNYFYYLTETSELWKFNFITKQKKRIDYFPNMLEHWGIGFSVSSNNEELVYAEQKRRNKVIIIEDALIPE